MCIQVQEFFETCCHMTKRTLHCDSDDAAPCPDIRIHSFTDYLTSGSCVFCTGRQTRAAIANLKKEISLAPDVITVPEDSREALREEWRGHTKAFRKKRHLRDDLMEPIDISEIDQEKMQCIHCWRQFDGKGDDCCENPRKLFCGHVFGHRCILEWLFTSGKNWCPTCRKGFERPREINAKTKRHGMIIENADWNPIPDFNTEEVAEWIPDPVPGISGISPEDLGLPPPDVEPDAD